MNDSFREFAEQTVVEAGKVLKEIRGHATIETVKDTAGLDIATTADYKSEAHILTSIYASYPGYNVMTEETAQVKKNSPFEWIIDPLDGTKEYMKNIPYYYVLLALEKEGKLIASASFQPEVNRLFSSDEDGAYLNRKQIFVSKQDKLPNSFISFSLTSRFMEEKKLDSYLNLIKLLSRQSYRLRSTAWDVESLFHVATGAYEGFVLPPTKQVKWWDIAPGIHTLRQAGGMITDFFGKPIVNHELNNGLVASNGVLHFTLIDLITSVW